MIIRGTVTFRMIGAYCEELITALLARNIPLRRASVRDGVIFAETQVRDYPAIARMARKYGVRTRVIGRRGAYFAARAIGKRPGLIAGILVSAVTVLTLRLFIWHIDIHGNNELSDDYMLSVLEQYGFTAGAFANATDALDAERKIMLSTDRIKWINIEVNGSRADVYMSENDPDEKPDVDYKTPCNIVAARSGVITDADVDSGKLMYPVGSGVSEGSVIVSGAVSSGDSLILVHSDARITAEFTDSTEFSMLRTTKEKVPSDESFTHRQLMVLGIVIPLDGSGRDTSDTVCTEMTEQFSLFEFPMPVKLRTQTFTRYKEVSVTRRSDDIRRLLGQQLELYIHNMWKDSEVLDVVKNFTETDEGITLNAEIKLKGDIAVKQPIYEH